MCCVCVCVCVCVLVAQLCLTLCDAMDCSPPGSSVHGILQAGLSFPSPGDLSDPGIKPRSPTLQADSLQSEQFINRMEYCFVYGWHCAAACSLHFWECTCFDIHGCFIHTRCCTAISCRNTPHPIPFCWQSGSLLGTMQSWMLSFCICEKVSLHHLPADDS